MPGVDDNHIAQPPYHISPNEIVERPPGVGQAVDLNGAIGIGEAVNLGKEDNPFYGPWIGSGLRVELKRLRGVTKKGVLDRGFRFQVPPMDSFKREKSVVANDYTTIQRGTFTDLDGMELETISFETLVTIEPAPWVITRGMWDPTEVATRLKTIMERETPMRLVAWHPGPTVEVSMPVTLRSLGIEEREPDSRYLTPSFTEWRDPILRRRTPEHWPKKHKLLPGDTLTNLARSYYHDATFGRVIARANDGLGKWGNRTPIVKNKHFKKGDVVVIPEPPEIGIGPAEVAR